MEFYSCYRVTQLPTKLLKTNKIQKKVGLCYLLTNKIKMNLNRCRICLIIYPNQSELVPATVKIEIKSEVLSLSEVINTITNVEVNIIFHSISIKGR